MTAVSAVELRIDVPGLVSLSRGDPLSSDGAMSRRPASAMGRLLSHEAAALLPQRPARLLPLPARAQPCWEVH